MRGRVVWGLRGMAFQWGLEASQNWDKLEGADCGQTHVDHPEVGSRVRGARCV
mgnify:CR=1 FL=1